MRRRIKLKENSVQQLASITKPVTATVVLQLVEEGKLKLSDTITQFLSELPEHYSRLTIKQLLSHRSGLSQYYYFCDHLMDEREKLIYNDTVLCVMNFHKTASAPQSQDRVFATSNYCRSQASRCREHISVS